MGGLAKYLRPYYGYMLLTIFIKLLGAVVELMIPFLLEYMLDDIVPTGNWTHILLCGGAMLLCALLCVVSNIVANRMSAHSSGQVTLRVRHDLFHRITHLSSRQLDQLTISSAVSRLTSDSYNVNQFLARIQRMGIRAPILLLGGIIITLTMNATLALVLIGLLPLIAVVVYFVTKTSVPLYTKVQRILDQVVQVVQENITGIRVIKALSKTEREKQRFQQVNQSLSDMEQKAGTITAITNPASSWILNLGLTGVVLVGAFQVESGATEPGVIIAFLNYFTMILNAMLGVTRIFIIWSKGQASANRIVEVLNLPDELQPEESGETGGEYLAFRDVSFSYNKVANNLEDISFSLKKGQTLGVLGATGSGKSTLIQLLLRFYDPDSGSILLDGQPLVSIPNDQLRRKFGVVFQNDFVMEGSIADNIRYFRDIPEEALAAAAEDAQAGFIWEKEGDMQYSVAVHGNNLSGGQKQRLLIARALASDPEILVLDDASSALDYATDAALRKRLAQSYRETTKIIIAQRISSIRHADQILMLEEGRILGIGTHSELMRTCSAYRQIAETQMGEQEVANYGS